MDKGTGTPGHLAGPDHDMDSNWNSKFIYLLFALSFYIINYYTFLFSWSGFCLGVFKYLKSMLIPNYDDLR